MVQWDVTDQIYNLFSRMGRAKKISRKFEDVDFCLSDLLDNGVTQSYGDNVISNFEER